MCTQTSVTQSNGDNRRSSQSGIDIIPDVHSLTLLSELVYIIYQ